MADWALGPDGKTLVWKGAGGAPLLSGTEQKAMRSQLSSAPKPASGGSVPAGPNTVIQQGKPKNPSTVPAQQPAGGTGNQKYFAKGGALPSGIQMVNGVPTASDTSFASSKDTIVQWPDGHKTVLMANGLSVDIPAPRAEGGHGGGGGGGGGGAAAAPAGPTKVLGPQTAKDLLPAFSPPAINQFPNFYDPGAYRPVAGSSNLPPGYTGETLPDIGNQSSLANILGVPWSAQALKVTPGQNGYGMPAGNDLKNNFVDPRVYGYIAPTLNPAFYQNARSSSK